MTSLNEQMLKAHETGEGRELARLYARAAQAHLKEPDQAAFYLTHAYVFALEAGMDEAKVYHAQLKKWGREE